MLDQDGASRAPAPVDYGAAGSPGTTEAPLTAGAKTASSTPAADGLLSGVRDGAAGEPFRPLNVLFGAAIVLGAGMIVLSLARARRPS